MVLLPSRSAFRSRSLRPLRRHAAHRLVDRFSLHADTAVDAGDRTTGSRGAQGRHCGSPVTLPGHALCG
jgi:hypothetical protein